MENSLSRLALRAAYGARQLPRVGWYIAHHVAMRQIMHQYRPGPAPATRPVRTAPVPDRQQLFTDMARLLQQDLANVEAGIYPLPADHDGPLLTRLKRSQLFFEDLPEIGRRRQASSGQEVLSEAGGARRPRYYLQNFHYQSGGWMTHESAQRYDTQVEVLFYGTANATRRQALPPLHELFVRRDQRKLRLVDVGCGTGRLIDCIKQVWPRLPIYGVDLSEPYIEEARRFLTRWSHTHLLVANGEHIPIADSSVDAVTVVFVMHEIPPNIRNSLFREFGRVLKPGGRLVVVDSLQRGDVPGYDGLLELFPKNFHEPYYLSYITENLPALAAQYGLKHIRSTRAFVSKVLAFDKVC